MITRKNDAFVAKIVNMSLMKIFMAIIVPDERLPSSATPFRVIVYHGHQTGHDDNEEDVGGNSPFSVSLWPRCSLVTGDLCGDIHQTFPR